MTRADIEQARAILSEGTAAHSTVASADISLLDMLGLAVNLSDAIPLNVIQFAIHYLVEKMPQFQSIMDALKGDGASIKSHAEGLKGAGSYIMDPFDNVRSGANTAKEQWTGEASSEFTSTVSAFEAACQNCSEIPPVIAEFELATGSYVGKVRELVRSGVHELIDAVVVAFVTAIPDTLLAAAGGGISGGLRGMAEGWSEGWSSGGFFSGVKGALSGGAKGAAQGALDAAVASVVAWANVLVADYLDHFANIMKAMTTACSKNMAHVRGLGQAMHRAASLLAGKGDPGETMSAGPGSYADTMGGAAAQPADIALAQVNQEFPWGPEDIDPDPSKRTRTPIPGTEPPQYYQALTDEEIAKLGIDPSLLNKDDGFTAGMVQVVGADGKPVEPPRYSVVMGGSTDGQQLNSTVDEDWIEDGIGAVSMSQQSADAMALATAVNQAGLGDNTIYTGHSLGGRLASVAAMGTGSTAVTFNAAGVSDPTYEAIATMNGTTADQVRADSMNQIRAYQTTDDPLTYGQQGIGGPMANMLHDAAGTHITVQGTTQPGIGGLPLNGHGTDNMVQGMGHDHRLRDQYGNATEGWADFANQY
ncbi:hypothetical protein HMPREF1531_01147 [Propionibacterium sp. oral taxon 192 str. F0372]|uniref:hypothetical protein n=1 Tax=Propionibacterium sp. oral taxon 192 TaxID=671222 RepID=UPI000352C583|nr:hypothetical protein [Propionibacterium sp. oral taxon 192]EPH04086.1 hypothetical protein HMPREF1531_01147 [Propionibacterium sp. oral taxon 192 str. F0372]